MPTEHGLTDIHPDGWTNDENVRVYCRAGHKCCPECGKKRLYRHSQVQPDVQDLPGRRRRTLPARSISVPRPRRAFLSTLRTCSAPPARSCPSASRRSANPSATRSRPATSPSAPASSSRWSWNSSASPAPTWSGIEYWKDYCHKFLLSLGMKEEHHAPARACHRRSCRHYSNGTTDYRVPVPLRLGRAVGHCGPHGFRPEGPARQPFRRKLRIRRIPLQRKKFIPYCVEPSLGADRVALAFLCDAYDEEELESGDVRTVLHAPSRPCALTRPPCCPFRKTSWATRQKEVYSYAVQAVHGGL